MMTAVTISVPPPVPKLDINAQDIIGCTALHKAAGVEVAVEVEKLLASNANPNIQNKLGETPLHVAITHNNLEAARCLLAAGANMEAQKSNGVTALHLAAMVDGEIVELLINWGANKEAQTKDSEGKRIWTPIRTAVELENTAAVQSLIGAGANVDARDENGQTSLHAAAATGQVEVVRMLIRAGANVHAMDKNGATPLHSAAESGNIEIVQLLSDAKAKINAWDEDGETALHRAAARGQLEIVKLLIDLCADKDARNIYGETAMHWAAGEGQTAVLETLLDKGAKELQDNNGCTILHWGAKNGQTKIVEMLIKRGRDVNVQDDFGWTSLHWAYARRCVDIYQMLCQSGAKWDLETGHEFDQIRLVGGAWGVGGEITFDGKKTSRDGQALRNPTLWVFSDILKKMNVLPEVAAAFEADKELDTTKRLDKIQKGELVVIETGYQYHAVTLVFYKGYLAICNRGEWKSTQVYKIDPSKITEKLLHEINQIACKKDSAVAEDFFYNDLLKDVKQPEDEICRAFNDKPLQKDQKGGFCAYDSPEAALFTILALQRALDPSRKGDIATAIHSAKEVYKHYTTFFRLCILRRYLYQIESGHIKREKMDKPLLEEIQKRLKNGWHPERFKPAIFTELKKDALTRLEKILI